MNQQVNVSTSKSKKLLFWPKSGHIIKFFYEVILHRLNIVEKRYDRVVMYTIWKN